MIALHGRSYYLHDEISGCGIDESTLLVDEDDEIWLPLEQVFQLKGEVVDSSDPLGKDNEAIQHVFDRFVPEELDMLEAQMESE